MASKHKIIQQKYKRYENTSSFPDLLESLPLNPRLIRLEVLINFYETMRGNYLIRPEDIQHPKFDVLRKATESLLPEMNAEEVTSILIAILPSKVIMHDRLTKQIIEVMVEQVNYLPLDQVLFVDFIMQKYYHTSELSKDYITLKSILYTSFLLKIENGLENCTDLERIIKVVQYCRNNPELIPSKVANRLTTLLLLMDEKEFSVTDIATVLIFLGNFRTLDEHMEKLLGKMFDLFIQSDVDAHQVENLLLVLNAKNRDRTLDEKRFYEPKFIQKCANSIIEFNNKHTSFKIQNFFNKLVSF